MPRKRKPEVETLARKLLKDPEYRKRLKERLVAGKVSATVESKLWDYAYGKPVEKVETTHTHRVSFAQAVREADAIAKQQAMGETENPMISGGSHPADSAIETPGPGKRSGGGGA